MIEIPIFMIRTSGGMKLEIPEPIRSEFEKKGGILGLEKYLPPEDQLERLAKVFRALANPLRLKVLKLLEAQSLCPCILAQMVHMADSKLSYHLAMLRDVNLIKGEQKGRWIIYRLTQHGKEMLRIADQLFPEEDPMGLPRMPGTTR